MDLPEKIGKDFVDNVMNSVLRIYAGVLRDKDDPLRRNELLGPIVERTAVADPEALLDLIEHSTIMTMHACLNHFANFESAEDEYSTEVCVRLKDGTRTSLFDHFFDPGAELVEDGGWAERFADFR